MTTEQWRRVQALFERAVDLDIGTDAVDAWLRDEAADAEVAREVASLVDNHRRAGHFLEALAPDAVAAALGDDEEELPGGSRLGPYRLEREVGRGGMGRVYLAVDTRLGRQVALKLVPRRLSADPGLRERLRREARAAASLVHPGICTVFALEELEGELVLVSQYVEGRTLRDEIASGDRPTPVALLETARGLADALAAAHARGIVHRDLKPENVIRSENGAVTILDFGLALLAGAADIDAERVTTPGTIVGTPAYMAPEQLQGGSVDVRTDLFAWGVLVYEYATGVHPFAADSPMGIAARILEATPAQLSAARSDVPESVASTVDGCLRKDPVDRPISAAAVRDALRANHPTDRSRGTPRRVVASVDARVWWRVHQLAVIGLYAVASTAAWLLKEWEPRFGLGAFVLVGIGAAVGSIFRGHALFTERMLARGERRDVASFSIERRRTDRATTAVDLSAAAALMLEGLLVVGSRPVAGLLSMALGIGIALARRVVEPSTARSAFDS
ncbi:MAG: serine/threonine-protein kinase [Vicinamibacterales bacterium]